MNRRLLLVAMLVVGLAVTGLLAYRYLSPEPALASASVGGPFSLIDTAGRPVTEKTLLGKPTAIFFGFTYCPEVCPTTLTELTAAMKAIGPDADKLNVVFVSVDPDRDTPAQLNLYLQNFDRRIQGFTGTQKAIDDIAKAYRVYHRRIPLPEGGYTVDHSSAIYLFDKQGRFVAPIGYGEPHERVVSALRDLARRR